MLHVRKASLAYKQQTIFSGLNLDLPKGKWSALIGPSGVGKSSLLRMIAGISHPTQHITGKIYCDNALSVNEQLVYLPQQDLLLPWLTVLDNTLIGKTLRNESTKADRDQAKFLIHSAGLGEALLAYPHQLSGGMRKRAALVRTLMQNKPIVLMDEAFSSLDTITRYQLHQLAVKFLEGKTVLFITHDPSEALMLAHDIWMMWGKPAGIKKIAELTGEIPRQLSNATLTTLHEKLFDELTRSEFKLNT